MAWSFLDVDPPFGFAHRGGNGPAPENTVAAFSRATELGYRYLETDVHRTADGVLVAFHDDELERVAGLPGQISDYGWDRLSEVRLDGEHPIPRLTDLLEAFPDARFNIDPKADDAVDPLIEIIRSFDAVSRVCIGSFSDSRIERVQTAFGPELCTSPGPKGVVKVLIAAILGLPWKPPYACVQIPVANYRIPLDSAWLIGRVQKLGLQVHYWTINDRSEMIRLLDRGADAIITDETEVLKQVLEERGQWS
jgi:glycerophosphoryl diester phosphodiesterase